MGIFDGPIKFLKELTGAPQRAAQRVAPLVQAKLRSDATTDRGNVPGFSPGPKGHPFGNIPITAVAVGGDVIVSCPDWVLWKAIELGQVTEWERMTAQEADKSWWSRR